MTRRSLTCQDKNSSGLNRQNKLQFNKTRCVSLRGPVQTGGVPAQLPALSPLSPSPVVWGPGAQPAPHVGHLDPAAQRVWRKGRETGADPGPVADWQGRLEEVDTFAGSDSCLRTSQG